MAFQMKMIREVFSSALVLVVFPVLVFGAGEALPRAGYEYWIPNSETDSAGQHGIHFKKFINGSAYKPKYPFSFQRWDEPQLEELKNRLGLEELIKDAPTEFEAVKRITRMVCNLWAHAAPIEYPSWNALAILDRIDQGDQFWCTYKQLVAMQCFASLGIHSRIVPCRWHHSLEFWSNDYDKWVVMDAWTANYYTKDGVPLGALEMHYLSRKNGSLKGSGVYKININPNRWMPERTEDSTLAETDVYQHIRYIPRNDFLSNPLEAKPAGGPEDYLKFNNQLCDPLQTGLMHVAWWQPGDAPSLVCPIVRYEQDFNFPLNEVELSLRRPVTREGVLDVTLATHTPEFDSFYRNLDDTGWTPCGSRFLWELKPGENKLEVKSRNKWGRYGPPSVVVLEYRPEELKASILESLEIPEPGFEDSVKTAESWRMIYTDDYQKPAFYGAVAEAPHSGNYCYKIELNERGIWAKLISKAFRVNQASDVRVRLWLRADREGRKATLFIRDSSPGGPGSQAIATDRVSVGKQWRRFELRARLSARTTHAMVGVQVMGGTLWVDDFSIREDHRAELPW